MVYLYEIKNDFDDYMYVGVTCELQRRWTCHRTPTTLNRLGHYPLYAAMKLNGAECFRLEVVASFATAREAFAAEGERIAFHVKSGTPLYNQNSVSSYGNWNGKVFRNRVYGVWAGKYRDATGKRRTKQVPREIQDESAALMWFADWLTESL